MPRITPPSHCRFLAALALASSQVLSLQAQHCLPPATDCEPPLNELFTFGFEGCPARVAGAPGEEKTFEVFPTLTVRGNPGPLGPDAWTASIAVEGGTVDSAGFQDIQLSTIFDHDQDPETPPLNPFALELADADFRVVSKATGTDPESPPAMFHGVIAVTILDLVREMALQPNGVHRMARMTVRVQVPEAGAAPATVRLRYKDGLLGGGETVWNLVKFEPTYWAPLVEECVVQVSAGQPFLRCDPNDDLRVDIADPIWIVNELFGAGPATRCPLAADCNGDGAADISDVSSALAYLFRAGPPPPPPFPECGAGAGAGECESGSSNCS